MATLRDFGVYGQGDEILQPYLSNRFRLEFTGLGNSRFLTVQAVSVEKPTIEYQEIELHRYNSIGYIFGKSKYSSVNVTFEADASGNVSRAIQEQLEHQQRNIANSTVGRAIPAAIAGTHYKFKTIITQLDGDNGELEKWYLDGCGLQNVKWGNLDYKDASIVTITATIRFDNARQQILGTEKLRAVGDDPRQKLK